MNVCKNCGFEYDGRYCPRCGIREDLLRVCKNCGTPFSGKYCPECGYMYSVSSDYRNSGSSDAAPYRSAIESDEVNDESAVVGIESSPARVCKMCGSVVNERFCSVCGSEYNAKKKCGKCGRVFIGNFCPECGTKGKSLQKKGERTYYGISRTICALFLTFGVLFLISCVALPWETRYSGEIRYGLNTFFDWSNFFRDLNWRLYGCLYVFSVLDAVVAIPLSITGLVRGGKKRGAMSLFKDVGVVAIVFMAIAIVLVYFAYTQIRDDLSSSSYSMGSGAICAMTFSIFFLLTTFIFLCLSAVLQRTNPSYMDAYNNERLKWTRN